jgi:hypothetical protein
MAPWRVTTSCGTPHAAFFEEGGKRVYVSRVFRPLSGSYPPADLATTTPGAKPYADGHGRISVGNSPRFRIIASHPGAAGNLRLRFGLKLGPNVLGALPDPTLTNQFIPTISNLQEGDVVWIASAQAFAAVLPDASPPGERGVDQLPIYVARKNAAGAWRFSAGGLLPSPPPANPAVDLTLDDFRLDSSPGSGDSIRPLTLSLDVLSDDGGRSLGAWSGLPLDPDHRTAGVPDSIFDLFSGTGNRNLPIVLVKDSIASGRDLLEALDTLPGVDFKLNPAEWDDAGHSGELDALRKKLERGLSGLAILAGGNDGLLPGRTEYQGRADPTQDYSTGFKQFESIEDISIVAAPGSTWHYADARRRRQRDHQPADRSRRIHALPDRGHRPARGAENRRRAQTEGQARQQARGPLLPLGPHLRPHHPAGDQPAPVRLRRRHLRAQRQRTRGLQGAGQRGGARRDRLRDADQHRPAGSAQPRGINCFRFFEGRGYRLWGARTISSDPEWKYVNLRRYFAYLERSIDKGTQWAVFEPNGEALWANVRATIRDFLLNEWASGALLGDKPEKAFFVRCDRSTMTQNDLDNGRLICLIGVAPLKPAEFVIFRIGQWTADRQS